MNRLILALGFLLGVSIPLCGTAQGQDNLFRLGALREEIHSTFGEPQRWYIPEAEKYANSFDEYRAALTVWHNIAEVYNRKTKDNEYEIRVYYDADDRESRLHPKLRVMRLQLLVDRPSHPSGTLQGIAEAREVCRRSCTLVGLAARQREIVAYAPDPTAEEAVLATAVASGWKVGYSASKWRFAVRLQWSNYVSPLEDRKASFEWLLQQIEMVTISVFDPELEQRLSEGRAALTARPVHLGSWSPTDTERVVGGDDSKPPTQRHKDNQE